MVVQPSSFERRALHTSENGWAHFCLLFTTNSCFNQAYTATTAASIRQNVARTHELEPSSPGVRPQTSFRYSIHCVETAGKEELPIGGKFSGICMPGSSCIGVTSISVGLNPRDMMLVASADALREPCARSGQTIVIQHLPT